MSYTSDDLALVRESKRALIKGERVSQVRSANGKTLVFQGMTLAEMNTLEAEITSSLARQGNTRRTRTRNIVTSKGL